ncbi:MAG: hypothetical protein QOC86_932 [Gaiellales bacterium]|nr:hypothetical protein [Gaiellales bacterium]
MGPAGWSWATLKTMLRLQTRSRTLLGAVVAAAILILPSAALADCVTTVSRAAFKGSIAEWYPQQCYSTALSKLGPDVNTYSPNVPANIKSAMRRDRTRKIKLTLTWLPRNKVRVTSTVKLKSSIQLRKGKKTLAKGSISGRTTTLKLKKTTGKLTGALLWKLGKKTLTVTAAAPLAKVVKKK